MMQLQLATSSSRSLNVPNKLKRSQKQTGNILLNLEIISQGSHNSQNSDNSPSHAGCKSPCSEFSPEVDNNISRYPEAARNVGFERAANGSPQFSPEVDNNISRYPEAARNVGFERAANGSPPAAQGVGNNSRAANDIVGGQADTDIAAGRANYLPGADPSRKLVDTPFYQLGSLVGISNSVSFIPDNLIFQVRQVFIKYLRQVVDNPVEDRDEVNLAWKKYILLPTILFNNSDRLGGKVKEVMKKKISLLLRDDWDSFTLASMSMRTLPTSRTLTTEQLHQRAAKLHKAGQLSRSYKLVVGENKGRLPNVEETFEALESKYPAAGGQDLNQDQVSRLRSFRFDESTSPKPSISIERLGKVIHNAGNMIAHSFDHVRYEHMKKLWGFKDLNPSENEFRSLYCKLINRLMCAEVPKAVSCFYRDCESFAVPKGDDDIRPLGKVSLDRKIASTCLLQLCNMDIREVFKGIQYGCEPLGTEQIIHSVRAKMELHPHDDCFFPDAKNAFNSSNRKIGLYSTMIKVPTMFPFMNLLYGSQSNLWYFGCNEGVRTITSDEGSHQGCTLGNFLCAMAFLPLLNLISSILQSTGFSKFFVDDGNICAPFEKMLQVLECLINVGPKFGYQMHLSKGTYLLGKCGSLSLALERKSKICELGIDPSIVKIHPDDYALASNDELVVSGIDPFLLTDREISHHVKLLYGAKILGSFVGTNEYISERLQSKIEKLNDEASLLIQYEDLQQRFQLFRWCFTEKINHILRTCYPVLTEEIAISFNIMKKRVICSILDQFTPETMPEWLWTQSCLPIREGGLGVKDSVLISYSAFAASAIDCIDSIDQCCPGVCEGRHRFIRELNRSLDFISSTAVFPGNEPVVFDINSLRVLRPHRESASVSGLQCYLTSLMEAPVRKHFLESLDDKHLAWFMSVSDEFASGWLNVLPKSPSLTFDSTTFQIAICHRLYLPQPEGSTGLRCDCSRRGEHPVIDDRCHHIITSCPKNAFGMNLHNAVSNTIKEAVNAAGFRAKREEVGCFQNVIDEFSERERRMRPDLTVFDLPGSHRKVIIDVSNICPIPISGIQPLNHEDAKQIQRAAQLRYDAKMLKYDAISSANGIKFQPIIFETTGRVHSQSLRFLRSVLRNISGYMDGKLLQAYWLNRISCSFQQQLAISIRDKLRKQKGQRFIHGNFENTPEFAIASGSVFLARN